jgi:hypothetical protein
MHAMIIFFEAIFHATLFSIDQMALNFAKSCKLKTLKVLKMKYIKHS